MCSTCCIKTWYGCVFVLGGVIGCVVDDGVCKCRFSVYGCPPVGVL